MDPPEQPQYVVSKTLMVITPAGKILQLFAPIKAVCNTTLPGMPVGTTVFIEAIVLHKEHKMCYRIISVWYVYWCISIIR